MPRALRLDICTVVVVAVAIGGCSAAQRNRAVTLSPDIVTVNEGFKIDNALATQGEVLFRQRSCGGCHAIGRHLAGPDLYGVVEHRQIDWLKNFIMDPPRMIETDPIAQALYKENLYAKMPKPGVSSDEVMAVIHYLAAETQRIREAEHRSSE